MSKAPFAPCFFLCCLIPAVGAIGAGVETKSLLQLLQIGIFCCSNGRTSRVGPSATSSHVSHFSKVVKGQPDKLLCQDSRVASGKHKLTSKPNANHMCQLPGDKDVGLKGLKDSYLESSSKGLRSTQMSGVSFILCPFLGLSSFTYWVGGSHVIGTFHKRIPGHFSFGK